MYSLKEKNRAIHEKHILIALISEILYFTHKRLYVIFLNVLAKHMRGCYFQTAGASHKERRKLPVDSEE